MHFKTLRIDGTVTHLLEREKRINLFQQNKDYSVFLLTTQVGGVVLTLTAAIRVVIQAGTLQLMLKLWVEFTEFDKKKILWFIG